MHADDIGGPAGCLGDRIHVERRGIGREHGARAAELAEPAEDLALHGEALEDRLDHEVRTRRRREGQRALHAAARSLGSVRVQPALALGGIDRRLHAREPRIERLLLRIDQDDRDAAGREADGDAGAHRARTQHRRLADRAGQAPVRHRPALREEEVTQGPAIRWSRRTPGTTHARGPARHRRAGSRPRPAPRQSAAAPAGEGRTPARRAGIPRTGRGARPAPAGPGRVAAARRRAQARAPRRSRRQRGRRRPGGPRCRARSPHRCRSGGPRSSVRAPPASPRDAAAAPCRPRPAAGRGSLPGSRAAGRLRRSDSGRRARSPRRRRASRR